MTNEGGREMKLSIVAAALVLAAGLPASARPLFTFDFPLDGLQEVPPNPSPGTGTGHVELDTDTNMLSWNITFGGLLAGVTAAHFHAPAPPGVNAGVALGIAGAGATSPIVGSAVISETFEGHILAGLSYVNIHSQLFPGGEIRGQVVPGPAPLALVGIAGLVGLRRRR
jgi:hypothetical protein